MYSGNWCSTELSLHPVRCLLLPDRSPSSKRCFVYLTLQVVVGALVVVAAVLFIVPVVLAVVVLVGVESQVRYGSYPLRQAVSQL
ncbi:hypothetical protein BpHYR1_038638 [Brachionus plicatilis]|uniref:Uncharacterized protein n=1 Tax=Brachionus plicatilis TaxID=10195 RepID=A0A3M7QPE3_BRAPC|nr:hypothetical protein BpHYR1_038638 [Brachionus plicatilis]